MINVDDCAFVPRHGSNLCGKPSECEEQVQIYAALLK